jgi:mannose-6-phosphate isomerase-like protein (cupin superfamily)
VLQVSVVGPAEGEHIELGSTSVRVLEDGSTTSQRLGLVEIRVEPYTDGPPQHRHARHDEGFYVVSGRARFTVGQTDYEATAGTLVMVPLGAPHTFANIGEQTLVMLNTFSPGFYTQFFRDLAQAQQQGRPLNAHIIADAMAPYATELATTYAAPPAPGHHEP